MLNCVEGLRPIVSWLRTSAQSWVLFPLSGSNRIYKILNEHINVRRATMGRVSLESRLNSPRESIVGTTGPDKIAIRELDNVSMALGGQNRDRRGAVACDYIITRRHVFLDARVQGDIFDCVQAIFIPRTQLP